VFSFNKSCTSNGCSIGYVALARQSLKLFLAVSLLLGLGACVSIPDNCFNTNVHPPLVIFGDSYSDTGNIAIDNIIDFPPPFFEGRVSNGRLAVDHLATHLSTVAEPSLHTVGCQSGYNYAVGGGNVRGSDDGDLVRQVDEYLKRSDDADPNALFFVMMAGNDVRQMSVGLSNAEADTEIDSILDVLFAQLQRLVDAGARNLMISNSGNMGKLPGSIEDGNTAVLQGYSERYNLRFSARLTSFSLANTGLTITPFDLFATMDEILTTPTAFGFINSTEDCFKIDALPQYHPDCGPSNIDEFVFFDSVHATARTHTLIAQKIIDALP